jgi:hypothetical protein
LGKKYAIGEEEIMPVKMFKDFGGGITDFHIDAKPDQYEHATL